MVSFISFPSILALTSFLVSTIKGQKTALPGVTFSSSGKEDALTETLSKIQTESKTVGFSVAVLNVTGSVIYTNGFGQADKENNLPYTVETQQLMGSTSKTLLGVSLLKAQELNLLQLDDPINDYLPFPIVNPFHKDTAISIRHLAQHTSSIQDTRHYEKAYIFSRRIPSSIYCDLPWGWERLSALLMVLRYNCNKDMPLQDFIYRIYHPNGRWYRRRKSFLKSAPGEVEEYSNNGSAIASMVIEGALRKAGVEDITTYEDFTKTYILDPLGMTDSGWDMAGATKKSKLYPYGMSEIPTFRLITSADGGFVTNAQDFSVYLGAIMRGLLLEEDNILTAQSYKEMLSFGSGIFWFTFAGDDQTAYTIGHDGSDPGVSTIALFNTEREVGFIYIANTNDDDTPWAAVNAMGEFVG